MASGQIAAILKTEFSEDFVQKMSGILPASVLNGLGFLMVIIMLKVHAMTTKLIT